MHSELQIILRLIGLDCGSNSALFATLVERLSHITELSLLLLDGTNALRRGLRPRLDRRSVSGTDATSHGIV